MFVLPDLRKIFPNLPAGFELIAPVFGAILAIATTVGIGLAVKEGMNEGQTQSSSSTPVFEKQVWDWESRTDLIGEEQTSWFAHDVIDDGKAIRVFFNTGSPSCHGIRSEVTETPTTVTIKIFDGGLPEGPEQCTLEGTQASTVVKLKEPLNGRIVKGRNFERVLSS